MGWFCRVLVGVALGLAALGWVDGEFTRPQCEFALEVMVLQDFSDSVVDDLPVLAVELPKVLTGIQSAYPGSRYGLGTFVDKPLQPFGFPFQGSWFAGDYCYNVSTAISDEDPEKVVERLTAMPSGGGADWPENQLGALHDIALNGEMTGWSESKVNAGGAPIRRVIVLSTDAMYHKDGDGATSNWGLRENDGDATTVCAEEDYPSVEQLREALKSRQIYTIFLAGDSNKGDDLVGVYEELLFSAEIPGGAYRLNADSSNIRDAMHVALENLNNDTCQLSTLDVVFSQDVTFSYNNDISTLNSRISSLASQLQQEYISPQFGFTTFGDKPIKPFGRFRSGDYCYKLHQPLTFDPSAIVDATKGIAMTSGFDWKESQLDAIISSVKDPGMGWRQGDEWMGFGLYRILIVATDAGYHEAGDAAKERVDLQPHSGSMVDCLGEDYPTWQQTAEALVEADVHPLFIPTSDIAGIYKNLLAAMEGEYGIVGLVVELKDAELADVVISGIKILQEKLRDGELRDGGRQRKRRLPSTRRVRGG